METCISAKFKFKNLFRRRIIVTKFSYIKFRGLITVETLKPSRHYNSTTYLEFDGLLVFALDPLLRLQYSLYWHVRLHVGRGFYFRIVSFFRPLSLFLDRFAFHPHRQTFLIATILTP